MKKQIIILLLLLYVINVNGQNLAIMLENACRTYAVREKFSGTVLVAKNGKVLLKAGFGYRDKGAELLNNSKTIYQVASLAKQFTAAVILKLQEEKLLHVSDPLSKYYPDYPRGNEITLHHLLSHTSGIFNYTDDRQFMSRDQSGHISIDSIIAVFKQRPLAFTPGSKFAYSNSGYTLLGLIIEKITWKNYEAVLNELIISPLKLKNTGYDFQKLKSKQKSVGYLYVFEEEKKEAPSIHSSLLFTTGALYSTVEDLLKWLRTLIDSSFLNNESKKMMYTANAGVYGYGVFCDSLWGKMRVSHDGNVAGYKANINRIPQDDVCVIALSNSNNSEVGGLVRVLMSILYHQPHKLPDERKTLSLSADTLLALTGKYVFSESVSISVELRGGNLFIHGQGLPATRLYAESGRRFFGKSFNCNVEFIKQEEGNELIIMKFSFGKDIHEGKKVL